MDKEQFLSIQQTDNVLLRNGIANRLEYKASIIVKALWNSSENNLYGIDKKKAIKCIPDIENYEYVPVNNSMLAKAEIPFLIFERNRGKCFIEMY